MTTEQPVLAKGGEILKEGFRRMDERNLVNMETKGPPQ